MRIRSAYNAYVFSWFISVVYCYICPLGTSV